MNIYICFCLCFKMFSITIFHLYFKFKMHAVGIHSAMAIKRQRKRRDEQKRARERRYSTQSSESGETFHSPSGSFRRKFHQGHSTVKPGPGLDSQVTRTSSKN